MHRKGGPLRFDDRLLAEAVRRLERDGQRPLDDPASEQAGLDAAVDLETRIVARARALPAARDLEAALQRLRRATAVLVGLLLVAALCAGAAGASTALSGSTFNVFMALGALLGVQVLLLAVWAILAAGGARLLASASLGGLVLGLAPKLGARARHGSAGMAAASAAVAVFGGGAMGRWTLSAVSHALWVFFNAGCVLLVVLMLSARHYRFVWETTILSGATYARVTEALGWLPGKVGFDVPDAAQVAASDATTPAPPIGADEPMRVAWAGFLVGCLVVYGLMPRAILLVVCAALAARARRRCRLDLSQPGFARLGARLMPESSRLGVVDAAGEAPIAYAPIRSAPARGGGGAPVIMGLEIVRPASAWPPSIDGARFRDLGMIDGRADRQRVLTALGEGGAAPSAVVVVCELTGTPDRGHVAFLSAVRAAAGAPVGVVLTGGEALRRRGGAEGLPERVLDWRRMAAEAGIEPGRVIEVDLDCATDVTIASVAALAGATARGAATPTRGTRRVEAAFDLIVEHAAGWSGAPGGPGPPEQAALQSAIGGLYRHEHERWRSWLRAPGGGAGGMRELERNLPRALRAGADRFAALLPPRLRVRPGWLAAGAVAGAAGCLAAATLLAPAAITALPLWSAAGAALGAIAAAARGAGTDAAGDRDAGVSAGDRFAEAVRAAALFAMVLELQGRGEGEITAVLEAVIDDDSADAPIATAGEARPWLDGLRHRFDLALAREGRS